MKKIILIIMGLMLLAFSGCSNTAISVNDGLTFQEQNLLQGNNYIYSITANNVVVGSNNYFLGCTQNNPIMFYGFELETSVTPFSVLFYEAPVVTNNGTRVYGLNLNRVYSDTHELKIYLNPTITNNGTFIFNTINYGDKKTSGELTLGKSILKANTCYLFNIINQDAAIGNFNINFKWIEYN